MHTVPMHSTQLFRILVCGVLVNIGLAGCGRTPMTLAVEPSAPANENTSSAPVQSDAQPRDGKPQDPNVRLMEKIGSTAKDSNSQNDSQNHGARTPMAVDTNKSLAITAKQLVGRWQDSFFGKRTLILNADGTAKMILDLDFAGSLIYGRRMEFDMQWSIEGATVTIDIVEGRPEKSAKSAIETWGSRYEYLLDCVEDEQIEMRTSDGSMNHVLRRLPDEA